LTSACIAAAAAAAAARFKQHPQAVHTLRPILCLGPPVRLVQLAHEADWVLALLAWCQLEVLLLLVVQGVPQLVLRKLLQQQQQMKQQQAQVEPCLGAWSTGRG
jgi:hypothetical protein